MGCDVIVIGSGLAGLTAALHLQRAGRRVLVLERLPVAGGLCGSFTIDGYEFVRACNEFGAGLVREFAELGVPVEFRRTRSRLHLKQRAVDLPAAIADIPGLLRTLPDLLGVVAYLAAVPMKYIRVEDVLDMLTGGYGYGFHQPSKPVGGPQAMIDGMVGRLKELGGELRLGVESLDIQRSGKEKSVVTPDGIFRTRQVITSQPLWNKYPNDSIPGLHLGQMLLAVREDFSFPREIQTVYHVPSGVREWMDELDAGKRPQDFGFSVVRNFLPRRPGHQTLVSFFMLSRGEMDLSAERSRELERYILANAERMLPGLNQALLYRRILSPDDFAKLHGLSSAPLSLLPPAGFRRPDSYDPQRDVYHVGSSVHPPGGHAGAAVLGGALAAHRVDLALSGVAG